MNADADTLIRLVRVKKSATIQIIQVKVSQVE